MSLEQFALQTLNGLTFGALLFLLASGFTLVYGLMRIVNLAHGALYLVGGYVAVVVMARTGSFPLAVASGILAGAVLGLAIERLLLRRVSGQELPEVLLTVGIAIVIGDLCLAVFGGKAELLPVPAELTGATRLGSVMYPTYRLVVMVVAVVVGAGLYLGLQRTRLGARIRAGVDDREMASAMGVGIDRLFVIMFALGAGLAGLAGAIGAGLLTMRPGADLDILLYALVVVIVGGLGSIPGAALGAIVIGLIDAYSKTWFPEFATFAVFAPMALILVVRPTGLLGRAT
ncbi:MAG: branched-chain amino acid ABC transporter permease [Chloroflexi bacterium]|nr:branched-chain amino acid ABC transporter permease [Chloroflexota bacterium]